MARAGGDVSSAAALLLAGDRALAAIRGGRHDMADQRDVIRSGDHATPEGLAAILCGRPVCGYACRCSVWGPTGPCAGRVGGELGGGGALEFCTDILVWESVQPVEAQAIVGVFGRGSSG